jgi:hypothetical protein
MKMRFLRLVLLMLILLVTVAATACSKEHTVEKCASPAKASAAFRSAIKTQHQEWKNELKLRVALVDEGKHWHAWFQLPKGVLGGTATGKIDKASCHVFDISHEQ